MKKTVFSKRLFLFTLRLNWLPYVLVAAGFGFLGSLYGGLFYGFGFGDSVDVFNIADVGPLLRFLPLALIPLTVRSFVFYTKRCEADFYEALPYTRTQILVSVSAATALLAFGMLTVSAATSLIVFAENLKGSIFLIGESLLILLAYFIASLVAISATAVAISITGHAVNAALASYLIAFTPRMVINQIAAIAERSPLLAGTTEIFKNQYNLLTALSVSLPTLSAFVYSLILAISLFALALLLFKRRRSEIATSFCANKIVLHILRTALSFSFAMSVINNLISINDGNAFGTIAVAIFCFVVFLVVHFGYDLIAVKGKRAFISAAKGLPVLIGVCAIVTGIGFSLGAIMENTVPDADEMSYVRYTEISYSDEMSMIDYVDKELSGVRLYDEEARQIIARVLAENDEAYRSGKYEQTYYYSDKTYVEITVEIGLGAGRIVRNLMIATEDKTALDNIILEREDYRRIWMDLPSEPYAVVYPSYYSNVRLDRSEAALVYEMLLSELDSVGFDAWYAANCDASAEYIVVVVRRAANAFKLRIPITPETPKAYALMNELLDEKSMEAYQALLSRIDDAMSGGAPLDLSITIQTQDSDLFDSLYIDNSANGKRVGEFVKNCLTPCIIGDSQIYLQLFEDDFPFYMFALSDKYTTEELKQYFDESMMK